MSSLLQIEPGHAGLRLSAAPFIPDINNPKIPLGCCSLFAIPFVIAALSSAEPASFDRWSQVSSKSGCEKLYCNDNLRIPSFNFNTLSDFRPRRLSTLYSSEFLKRQRL